MEQILRYSDVNKLTGLNRSMLRRLEKSNNFPKRRLIGERAIGWLKSEIEEWLESLPQVV